MYEVVRIHINGSRVFFDNNFNEELTEDILIKIATCHIVELSPVFNYPIDNLNKNITHLSLGKYFNQSLDILIEFKFIIYFKFCELKYKIHTFPSSLKLLTSYNYKFELDNLPSSLLYLIIYNDDNKIHHTNLPCGLIYLQYDNSIIKFPESLQFIRINHILQAEVLNNLPNNLYGLSIMFNNNGNEIFTNLPNTLTSLDIFFNKNNTQIIIFPKNLVNIEITHSGRNSKLYNIILPDKLIYLKSYCNLNHIYIPSSVEILLISSNYNTMNINWYPLNLKFLQLNMITTKTFIDTKEKLTKKYPNLIMINHWRPNSTRNLNLRVFNFLDINLVNFTNKIGMYK